MELLRNTIEVGLSKPIRFLHVTDTHLPQYAPENESIVEERRVAETLLREMVGYAEQNGCALVHTGDLMTYCNDQNLQVARELFSRTNRFFAVGNHDFCHEGGGGDDVENVARNLSRVAPCFSQNLFFDATVVNGELCVVTLNDAFFQIDGQQLEQLKQQVGKGLPIVLCMHVPLFSPEHAKARLARGNCAHLLGPSEEVLAVYPERFQFHRANEVTLRAIDYIQNEPAIKVVIAGHTHMNYEERLPSGALQLVTACSRDGFAREITVI